MESNLSVLITGFCTLNCKLCKGNAPFGACGNCAGLSKTAKRHSAAEQLPADGAEKRTERHL